MAVPTEKKELLAGGFYAQKQVLCDDKIIAWSHGSRFKTARALVAPSAGKRLLDYGCGDGTFLVLVGDLFPEAVGAEVNPKQVEFCREHYADDLPGITFVNTLGELKGAEYDGVFDVVTCMEVLEHCVEKIRTPVIADLRRLVAPGGTLIVSVPVEIGPTLLGKEAVRAVAGWRGIGDYKFKEKYTPGELLRMVCAGERTAIARPRYDSEYEPGRANAYYAHKGFNWKALRRELSKSFQVERTLFSPLGWLGGWLSSQAWFVCRLP